MKARAILLALLLVMAPIGTVAAAPGSSSDVLGPSVTADVGLLGWSASDDVVRYGGEGLPGWFVEYSNGSSGDLDAWVNGSSSRQVLERYPDRNAMLIQAPASAVGVGLVLPWGENRLRDMSYVEAIGVNRQIGVDPVTPSEVAEESSWSKPTAYSIATLGGRRGELDASGAAWDDEVNTSTLDEVRRTVGADQVSANGSGIRVAVLDTGLDYDPDLYDTRVPAGYNAITDTELNISNTSNATTSDYEAVADGSDSNHGSWVATAIAGNGSASNATGIAPGATLVPVKVLGDDGSGSTADIVDGLDWACSTGNADVISMSLGSPIPSDQIESAIQGCLEDHDVSAVVVAAGNSRQTIRYVASPGDSSDVITVAATDARALNESESAYFSNVGPDPATEVGPTVGAPGFKITAEVAEGNRTLSGTSMATPIVSGTLALTLEANPSLQGQPTELRERLETTADPMPKAGTTEVGSGRVSAANAVDNVDPGSQEDEQKDAASQRDTANEALAGSTVRGILEALA